LKLVELSEQKRDYFRVGQSSNQKPSALVALFSKVSGTDGRSVQRHVALYLGKFAALPWSFVGIASCYMFVIPKKI